MALNPNIVKGVAGVVIASASLMTFTNMWEGDKQPYLDIAGVPTYCGGITNPPPIMNKHYSPQECNALNLKRTEEHGLGVLNCVTVRINQNQYEALADLSTNIGIRAACNSRAVKLINQSRFIDGCNAIATSDKGVPVWSYITVNGQKKFVKGLYDRRRAERKLCLTPVKTPTKAASFYWP